MRPSFRTPFIPATSVPALYAARQGGRDVPLSDAQQMALDALWPSLVASMRRGAPPSGDYIATRCECTRAQVVAYMVGRGCIRGSSGKWRLPSIVNPRKWQPN